jgi:putative transposase
MKQNKAYKLRLYPNKEQKVLLDKTFGSCRFVYNNALAYKQEAYEHSKQKYTKYDSINDLTEIKKIEEYSWLKEVDSVALQQSLIDMDRAYQGFFKKKSRFPKFKSKHGKNTYRTNNIRGAIHTKGSKIKLPKLGYIKFRDPRTIIEKIKFVTLSRTKTGKYFASVLVEYDFESQPKNRIDISKIFAADMSCKDMMVSEEIEFENQKFYRNNHKKLRRKQRNLARKKKGSNNRNKARLQVARLHEKIKNQRKEYQKYLADKLVSKFDVFIFEDLNVEGMKQFNSGVSKTVTGDFSWSEFLSFLEWKCFKENKYFIKIDRWFPSSKLCHECGTIKENLKVSDRTYICDCGYIENRDINAARNIKREGLNILKEQGINLYKNSTDIRSGSYALGDMNEVTCSAGEVSLSKC